MVLCLAACDGTLPKPATVEQLNTPIAQCGAGLGQGTSAALNAAWQKSGGSLSADFKQTVQTAILSDTSIPSSDRQKYYDNYLQCIQARSK